MERHFCLGLAVQARNHTIKEKSKLGIQLPKYNNVIHKMIMNDEIVWIRHLDQILSKINTEGKLIYTYCYSKCHLSMNIHLTDVFFYIRRIFTFF